jgi:ATP-dependent protease Clp ATPase subunit
MQGFITRRIITTMQKYIGDYHVKTCRKIHSVSSSKLYFTLLLVYIFSPKKIDSRLVGTESIRPINPVLVYNKQKNDDDPDEAEFDATIRNFRQTCSSIFPTPSGNSLLVKKIVGNGRSYFFEKGVTHSVKTR